MERADRNLLAAAGMAAFLLAACGEDAPPPVSKPEVAPPAAPAPPRADAKPDPAPKPAAAAADSADRELAARVKEAFLAAKELNAHGIDVGAKNGVVTLFGTVHKKSELERAARIAAGTEGARSVENKLVILAGS